MVYFKISHTTLSVLTLFTGSENVEFICNVLVMADQLLVSRLVEICEVTLSGLGKYR